MLSVISVFCTRHCCILCVTSMVFNLDRPYYSSPEPSNFGNNSFIFTQFQNKNSTIGWIPCVLLHLQSLHFTIYLLGPFFLTQELKVDPCKMIVLVDENTLQRVIRVQPRLIPLRPSRPQPNTEAVKQWFTAKVKTFCSAQLAQLQHACSAGL